MENVGGVIGAPRVILPRDDRYKYKVQWNYNGMLFLFYVLHSMKEIVYVLDGQHQMYLNRLHHIVVERGEYEHHYHWLDDSYLEKIMSNKNFLFVRKVLSY